MAKILLVLLWPAGITVILGAAFVLVRHSRDASARPGSAHPSGVRAAFSAPHARVGG